MSPSSPSVDVLVITALQDELLALLALGEGAWSDAHDAAGFPYHVRAFARAAEAPLVVAASWSGAMGGTAASTRALALVAELSPRCLAMCGICAGRRGEVTLGDVIVADRVFRYDHGKLVAGTDARGVRHEDLLHDFKTYNLKGAWEVGAAYLARMFARESGLAERRPALLEPQRRWLLHALLAHRDGNGPSPVSHPDRRARCPDWPRVVTAAARLGLVDVGGGALSLTPAGVDEVLREALLYPDGRPEPPPFRVHVGPIATGEVVSQDPQLFERLARVERKTLGVEMEAAAIGLVADHAGIPAVIVKAVSDHGDDDKDDGFRLFACEASAAFLLAFLTQYVHEEPRAARPAPGRPGNTQIIHNHGPVGQQIVNHGSMTLHQAAPPTPPAASAGIGVRKSDVD